MQNKNKTHSKAEVLLSETHLHAEHAEKSRESFELHDMLELSWL